MSRDELIDCIGPKAEAYRIDTAETYGFDESEFAFSESITPNFLQSSTGTTPKPTKPKASTAKPKASKPKAKPTPSKMVEGRRVGPKTDARSELLVEVSQGRPSWPYGPHRQRLGGALMTPTLWVAVFLATGFFHTVAKATG